MCRPVITCKIPQPFIVHTCVDGTVLHSDGRMVSPDGKIELPDGACIRDGFVYSANLQVGGITSRDISKQPSAWLARTPAEVDSLLLQGRVGIVPQEDDKISEPSFYRLGDSECHQISTLTTK